MVFIRALSAALALALQLALELVEEAPVSSFREDLVGARLDDTRLAETQGPEPHRVLGFVVPPPEPDLLDSLQDVLVLVRDAPVNHQASCPLRLAHAEIGSLQHSAQGSLCR